MALLHVVDDGREDGEIVRLRGDEAVIGRAEGDVVLAHDLLMSPRHARIARLPQGGWRLEDLGSGTGTFVRVDRARLRHERTIQVGATRLRFHEVDVTEAWLIEVAATGTGRRHECLAPLTTIGRAGCTIPIDDPFVDDVHAEIRHGPSGWRIRNTGANGLWVRIEEPVDLHATAQFLCGEQRFVFEPLG
jgi:pSer/pThr/pTyr-binding forkhead associated (FHA) protein